MPNNDMDGGEAGLFQRKMCKNEGGYIQHF